MTKEQIREAIFRTERRLRSRYAIETGDIASRVYEGVMEALEVLADELQSVLGEDE